VRVLLPLVHVILVVLVVPVLALAQNRPAPPAGDLRTAPGRPGWSTDARSGCWVWNATPQPNESATWSGGCAPDGRATGYGTVEWRWESKTHRYEGEYRDGKMHGRGVTTWADGDRYEGDYRDGKPHGRGVTTWADGDRYEGDYRDGKEDGRGVYTRADGTRYEGDYRDGKQHGRGATTWANGDRYEGDYRNGKQDGHGVFTGADGTRYEGEFRDGELLRRREDARGALRRQVGGGVFP